MIKNGEVYTENKLIKTNILIEKNKISKLTNNDIKSDKIIDAKNKIIIPGLIDSHVHFREPGFTYKEDFFTGSCAEAAGGITTFFDMPNTNPFTTTVKLLQEKRKLAKKSIVNYGLHFGASLKNNSNEIKKAKNIPSTKLYLNVTTGNMIIEDENIVNDIFKASKLVMTHAEETVVDKVIETNKKYGHGLHLAHITLASEIKSIKKAKSDSNYNNSQHPITCEVTPHHLFLTNDDFKKQKGFCDMKPTLKSKQDQESLWEAIEEGIIDTIATDHAPHTIEEKQQPNWPYGVPGCETMLPLLLDAYNKKRISLKKIVELCCENPTKIFKIKNKGFIKVGYDADLTIIDLNKEKKVNNDELLTKCKWSPFNNWKLKGWPIMTIVNGNIVYDNGKINDIKAREVEFDG